MARTQDQRTYTNFSKGFITETTGLGYPENSCRDINNCDIELKGVVRRRLGLLPEPSGEVLNTSGTGLLVDRAYAARLGGPASVLPPVGLAALGANRAVSVHTWPSVANRGDINFVVFQIGNRLVVRNWDFDPNSSYSSISSYINPIAGLSPQFDIDDPATGVIYNTSWVEADAQQLQSTFGFGRLWFTGPHVVPFYLEYNPLTQALSARAVGYNPAVAAYANGRLAIRDFNGVPDGLLPAEEPTTLTNEHRYNLLNQGWREENWDKYKDRFGRYPSNSQQWFLGKKATDSSFDPELLAKAEFGGGLAPKGSSIINILSGNKSNTFLNRNYDYIQNSNGVAFPTSVYNEPSSQSFKACTFFAGRLWLGGDVNSKRSSGVYFSKTISQVEDAGIFMQEGDPTAENFSDLLATDGGVIYIPEAGQILKLVPFVAGVLVMATNGIWYVYGGEGAGSFTATTFSVTKLSTIGLIAPQSVVQSEAGVLFFAENSISGIVRTDTALLPNVADISLNTIFSFYSDIPREDREQAQACYDSINKKVFWSYRNSRTDGQGPLVNSFSRMLVFDNRSGAWSKYDWAVSKGPAYPKRKPTPDVVSDIVVDGANVVIDGSDDVIADIERLNSNQYNTAIRVMLIDVDAAPTDFYIGDIYSTDFLDFDGAGGTVEYTSNLVTADEVVGDLKNNKQVTYLHSFFNRTEENFELVEDVLQFDKPSSCNVRARWDWHTSTAGNRWSDYQRAYRYKTPPITVGAGPYDNGESILYTKLKIRGKGRAVSFEYTNGNPSDDFQLLGYTVSFTANAI